MLILCVLYYNCILFYNFKNLLSLRVIFVVFLRVYMWPKIFVYFLLTYKKRELRREIYRIINVKKIQIIYEPYNILLHQAQLTI